MAPSTFDYIILGGGLSGCVVASRLRQARPDLSIALIENGSDIRSEESIHLPAQAWLLDPKYYYIDHTVPQTSLGGRSLELKTGRALGGGSATNYGGWMRGDRQGYDEWAAVVGDERWSYEGLLPFFKRSETFPVDAKEAQHGYAGPMRPSLVDRGYPLKNDLLEAILSAGFERNEDITSGDVLGVGPLMESWRENRRVHAANSYDLKGVEILTGARVERILLEGKKAVGAVLAGGEKVMARKETIVACGALRTPQLLMLSGIGPGAELEKLGIETLVHSQDVGKNLHDHPMFSLWYTLRHPEEGLAFGHPKFMNNPKYFEGNPMDWIVNGSAPPQAIQKAAQMDGVASKRTDDFELTPFYLATPISPHPPPPMDGATITLGAVLMSTTSRGQVTLQSKSMDDPPLVDPNYLSTEHDLAVMRAGVRTVLKIMESTDAGRKVSVGQWASPEMQPINTDVSDEELDQRAKAGIVTCYHYAGTASMGKVVDADCKVKGVEGMRIVDASIMPVAMSAHLQAVMYGVAERAAEMILEDAKNR
ncbi:FAD NAD(P)-binding [Lecanosticta acicola]|uniref:FAD NAD(P)-binding n=1 Tax=Lecanosticta acicola TaxID=111012 RepID=A0AAI8YX53_9PEZI|nr:FAD NAD(P)-binding [Lecanosticta acicola]